MTYVHNHANVDCSAILTTAVYIKEDNYTIVNNYKKDCSHYWYIILNNYCHNYCLKFFFKYVHQKKEKKD